MKAFRVRSAADVAAAEAFRTDFHLFDAHRHGTSRRHRRELRLGPPRRPALAGADGPRRRADARERRRGDRGRAAPTPSTSSAASRPSRASRTRRRSRRSSRRCSAEQARACRVSAGPAVEERFGALRRPLRPRDADRAPSTSSPPPGPRRARTRPSRPSSRALLRDFVGRPTPLYLAERLSERVGRRVYLKREDLAHTGAHKINNAVGQALLAKRMGKTRIIAETGAGQHGVATATACALLGPRVRRLHGHRGHPPPGAERRAHEAARREGRARRGRGPHAEGGGQRRDPRLGRDRRRHPLRDRLRGRPGALPGAGPRPAARDRRRGPLAGARGRGDAARARDRLRRRRLQLDRHLLRLPRRPGRADRRRGRAARGSRAAATAPRSRRAPPGSCTAPSRRCSPTSRARSSRRTRSRPASTTRASGPSTRYLRDTGRARYVAVTDDAGAARLPRARRGWRGSSPRSSPRTRSPGCWRTSDAATATTSSASPAAATRTWTRRPRSSPSSMADAERRDGDRRRRERARADRRGLRRRARRGPRRADAVHDGRVPRRRRRRSAIARGLRRRRRRPDRARHPLLGPARRRPRDPRRGDGGARGRRRPGLGARGLLRGRGPTSRSW